MDQNLYEILGVRRNASRADIRAAYLRLARQYHPDLNPNDSSSVERFRQIQLAYSVLYDEFRRESYDRDPKSFRRKAEVVRPTYAPHPGSNESSAKTNYKELSRQPSLFGDWKAVAAMLVVLVSGIAWLRYHQSRTIANAVSDVPKQVAVATTSGSSSFAASSLEEDSPSLAHEAIPAEPTEGAVADVKGRNSTIRTDAYGLNEHLFLATEAPDTDFESIGSLDHVVLADPIIDETNSISDAHAEAMRNPFEHSGRFEDDHFRVQGEFERLHHILNSAYRDLPMQAKMEFEVTPSLQETLGKPINEPFQTPLAAQLEESEPFDSYLQLPASGGMSPGPKRSRGSLFLPEAKLSGLGHEDVTLAKSTRLPPVYSSKSTVTWDRPVINPPTNMPARLLGSPVEYPNLNEPLFPPKSVPNYRLLRRSTMPVTDPVPPIRDLPYATPWTPQAWPPTISQ